MGKIDTILNLKEVVLSILFVAGDGIEKEFIAEKLEINNKELNKALDELKKTYCQDAGIHIKTRCNLRQIQHTQITYQMF